MLWGVRGRGEPASVIHHDSRVAGALKWSASHESKNRAGAPAPDHAAGPLPLAPPARPLAALARKFARYAPASRTNRKLRRQPAGSRPWRRWRRTEPYFGGSSSADDKPRWAAGRLLARSSGDDRGPWPDRWRFR